MAHATARHDWILPLFVLDDQLLKRHCSPNREAFLVESLEDLRRNMQELGGDLVIREGDPATVAVREAVTHGASEVVTSADVSATAALRERRLERFCSTHDLALTVIPGLTIVPPEDLLTTQGTPYRVFTPYLKSWLASDWREVREPPRRIEVPRGVDPGRLPACVSTKHQSPRRPVGGESEAWTRLRAWLECEHERAGRARQQPARDATSRLSPHLHFGCISPLELARVARAEGADELIRQLAWRDFHHQTLHHFPSLTTDDLRDRNDQWNEDGEAFAAWADGRTGYPFVDAGMRQLRLEGWMHNRARLVVASFLTKHLYQDWRRGAGHFMRWLVDGDVANNTANWQWVAGTGTDTRPNRMLNPVSQGKRLDPAGEYVRLYVPELTAVGRKHIHEPWVLGADALADLGYPEPIVDHAEAVASFRANRGL